MSAFGRSRPERLWAKTDRITCPSNSSGMPAMPAILCPYGHGVLGGLAAWRETKRAAMTENAIAKEIVDAAFQIHTTV